MDRPEPDLNAVEARLAQWSPSSSGLDRDRMLFAAGRASARSEIRGRLVAASVALLGLMTATLGGLFVREMGQRRALEIELAEVAKSPAVPAPSTIPIMPFVPPAPDSYLVLSRGTRNLRPAERSPSVPSSAVTSTPSEPPLRARSRLADL